MKLVLLEFPSKELEWSKSATDLYCKKISPFCVIERRELVLGKMARGDELQIRRKTREILLAEIQSSDLVFALDTKGASWSSDQWAQQINRGMISGRKRLVFVIGGAFGLPQDFLKLVPNVVSLGPATFNHLVARVVLLEQIYRAFTILKGLPYHNAE